MMFKKFLVMGLDINMSSEFFLLFWCLKFKVSFYMLLLLWIGCFDVWGFWVDL